MKKGIFLSNGMLIATNKPECIIINKVGVTIKDTKAQVYLFAGKEFKEDWTHKQPPTDQDFVRWIKNKYKLDILF